MSNYGISLLISEECFNNEELMQNMQSIFKEGYKPAVILKEHPCCDGKHDIFIGNIWRIDDCGLAEIALSSTGKIYADRGYFDDTILTMHASWERWYWNCGVYLYHQHKEEPKMTYTCELRSKKNLPIIDKANHPLNKTRYLTLDIPIRYDEVLNRVNIFNGNWTGKLNGKVARDTIPLLAHCVANLELGVNVYGELEVVKRLREMATTEPDAIWHIE